MKLLVVFLFATYVAADMYMHNPRGSNGRNREANTNRNNGDRLMDTQNNAKGGYCWGPAMSFYEGSLLSVDWTNQHGCGVNKKLYCNIVLQYMCGYSDAAPTELIRDGTTTDTITNDDNGPVALDGNGELLYGMHENRPFYVACQTRERNKGLWISDRQDEGNLNGNDATKTRQNNNGGRRGFECPEERDYYPYWAPTPWVDIVIMTHNMDWCDFYQKESENVKGRNFCADDTGVQAEPNNEAECSQQKLKWVEVESHNVPAPDCVQAPWSRDNHLGNGLQGGGEGNSYNWTLPTGDEEKCINNDNCNCVLRIRYNISTADVGDDGNRPDAGFIDWTKNAGASPVMNDGIYYQDNLAHELALDTSQFGRTFEDRSHVFHLKKRPDGVSNSNRIFNLNVRGKRGNIVQAYPATEYDFMPAYFTGRAGDYVHFQWTGCDTNPAGNAGEGTDQTDRSNMVQTEDLEKSLPASDEWLMSHDALFESKDLRMRMAMLGQTDCLTYEELLAKNNNDQNAEEQDVQNCMKLNAAPQYFDGGLIKMNTTGEFYYMSSRNNNFTNRGQKGYLKIEPLLPTWAVVVVIIGAVFFVGAAGVAGMMLYAKSHPHSGIATAFSKI